MKKPLLPIVGVFVLLFLPACARVANDINPADIQAANDTRVFDTVNEITVRSIVMELQETIIRNLENGYDIDFGINYNKIADFMANYETGPDSYLVNIEGMIFDLPVVAELLRAYCNIRGSLEHIKKEHLALLMSDYIYSQINDLEVNGYFLEEAILFYSFQIEISEVLFFYLFDLFQIPNSRYDVNELSQITISVSPLAMSAISIDGILYELSAITQLQKLMYERTEILIQNMTDELIRSINRRYDRFVENIDVYLDWYFGFLRGGQVFLAMLEGFFDRNTSVGEAVGNFIAANYVERIGQGVNFDDFMNTIYRFRDKMIEYALIYLSALERSALDESFDIYFSIIYDMDGDCFMSPFFAISDYFETVASVYPLMGMGEVLTSEGLPALDAANIIANVATSFVPIPFVDIILGLGIDYVTLRASEHLTRDDFRQQISASIRDTQRTVVSMIRFPNTYGGR